ncbi:FKBP-type peptidyl-prolyl cis-trans isomerase [Hymenobacter psychrophilus]|uniref:Peptidyl-prolyl cis-trans isomerase n=1 Tax=Hymenobacter psychrophilus TaxID=651662 RepID=A0A1H3KDB4_9BACT|nr:FKBP-type peptidyl-prolyl cis-trans isomerase [Hymenobacter psychrophilus]SDY49765.1 FKBP-type peptidyl-prolyl cis-trans isomerase [Hymenobacter psychrophilus]
MLFSSLWQLLDNATQRGGRFLALLLVLPLLIGCQSDPVDSTDYATRDEQLITDYIKANNLTGFEKKSSGLYVAVTQPGTGDPAVAGQLLTVLYTGLTLDGRIFDSTANRNNDPLTFTVGRGQVIAGWDEGFMGLRPGSKATLLIPSGLAYGARATGPIPAHAVLRFDVELLQAQ